MTSNTLTRIRNFTLLAFVQVLIFSQIHLFGYATACVYLIFILKLPRHTSQNEVLIWSFLFGLTIDIFCNTPGINAAAATAMGAIRSTILSIFTHKGLPDDFVPSIKSIKWGGYTIYSLACIGVFYTVLFILELFTISHASSLFVSVISSTMLTMLFVTVIECFSRTK